ncbi:MAG: M1 family metallopeptidase [Ignavibacteriaceae bacterium]
MRKSVIIYLLFLLIGFWGDSALNSLACNSSYEFTRSNVQNEEENYNHVKQYSLDILHYDIDISLDIKRKIIEGKVIITGILKTAIPDTIVLNFYDNMDISKLMINNSEQKYGRIDNKIFIPSTLTEKDTFNILIVYRGTPDKEGHASFIFGEINEIPLIYSLNEPISASKWLPSNDIPSDKVLTDMRITADSNLVSISNGKLISVNLFKDKKTYHWKTTYPISTYLISLNTSKYSHFTDTYTGLDNKEMEIHYFPVIDHLDEAKTDWEDHPQMIRVFAELFGEYPFIDEKYGVTEFLWMNGAMEHQTITSMGYKLMTGRKFFNDILVHELAHQWWGNAVGPASWKDIWLNEGFATYSEALYDEALYGKGGLSGNMNKLFSVYFHGTLYNPEDLFSKTVYDKGAWVLHMLRGEVGDNAFFAILRKYFETYKYKNASTEDFKSVAEKVSGKDLTKFFDQWVYKGEDIPMIEYDKVLKKENNKLYLDLELYQIQDLYRVYDIPIEIKVYYKNHSSERIKIRLNQREETYRIELKNEIEEVSFDPDTRILASFIEKEK